MRGDGSGPQDTATVAQAEALDYDTNSRQAQSHTTKQQRTNEVGNDGCVTCSANARTTYIRSG